MTRGAGWKHNFCQFERGVGRFSKHSVLKPPVPYDNDNDGYFYSSSSGSVKKEKKEPPKYPCHMCDIPVMFALTALRRHLARKHSTNFKCTKVGAEELLMF